MDRAVARRVLLVGTLGAPLFPTLHWALTRIYALNFSTAGPNTTALLALALLTGWTVALAPRLRARPRLVTAALAALVLATGLSTVRVGVGGLLAALGVQLLAVAVLAALVQGTDGVTVGLGGATGVTVFVALRAWLDTAPTYATPEGAYALIALALLALGGWLRLLRAGDPFPAADFSVPLAPFAAFVLAQGAFLAMPAAVAAWALRPYPLTALATVAGLLTGGALLVGRGAPDDRETAGWLVVFVVAVAALLWVDRAGSGVAALPAQAAAVVLLAAGSRVTGPRRPVREAGRVVVLQFAGIVLLFLHVAALNWAFMPAPLDSLARGRLPLFLFAACLLLPATIAAPWLRRRLGSGADERDPPLDHDRRELLGLAGAGTLGLAGVAAREGVAGVRAADGSPLTVMTYNVHQYLAPDGDYNLRAVRDVIASADPDIVGLQESDSGRLTAGGFDGVRWLAHALGYHHTFGTPTGDGSYGAALLSRWPIANERVEYLPVNRSPPRPALVADVQTPQGPLPVVATHFQTEKPGDRRAAEAERIVSIAADLDRAVLLGDFNTPPSDDQRAHRVLDGAFTDAWTAANGAGGGETYSAADPTKRIDYVWLQGDWRVDAARVVGGPAASDHRAVVATLSR
jgi:endonuclease/exonuclease/phosphatase family metal-dependent hydrolase